LSNLLSLFADNLLPILLASAIGYSAARFLNINPRSVTQVAFYIFSPCLLFQLLTTNQLQGSDLLLTVALTVGVMLLIGLVAWLIGRGIHLGRSMLAAVVLTAVFGNMGNFGLALNAFAFGERALAYASISFITESILIYTVGVVIISMGRLSLRKAMLGLLKIPSIYAVILAVIVNHFELSLPVPLDRTVNILSNAAIPVMMVILGIQLNQSDGLRNLPALTLSSLLRLAGGALAGLSLGGAFHLHGPALQASVTQSATPTAVVTTILASEFDVDPSFVTSVVISTTVISPLILTPLLYFLGA
jgi:predicted permease